MRSLVLACLMVVFVVGTASAGVKKIAVLDFEDASIVSTDFESNPMAAFAMLKGQQPQQKNNGRIGRSVSDILVTELAKDGTFKIVERNRLDQVLSEQTFGRSGAMTATDAAKLGRLLGVSGIIVGSVTEFNTKTETRGVFGVGTKVKTATVAVNARLIDTTSGEVVFAAEGKGSEEETNVSVGSFYGSNTTGASETLLSGATRKAAIEIIQTLKTNSARIKDQVIEGVVVNVDPADKSVMIDVGSEVGVALNQTMYAIKVIKEIKNRQGEVIKRLTSVVGEFKVKEVEKKVATLSCVAGDCPSIKEGDRVASIK